MSGTCLVKLSHSCGSRNGLQVFERTGDDADGTVDGFCFSCKTFVRHPFGEPKSVKSLPKPKTKTPEEIEEEIQEITTYPTVEVAGKRLRKEALEYYGVKTALSEEDGKTPTMLCYPYTRSGGLVGYKLKTLGRKRIWSIGDIKGADFFGWDQAISSGARKLIVTEGEDDAISLKRVLELYSKEGFKDFTAVISLPRGSSSAADVMVKNINDMKKRFEEISICFDNDDAGETATREVCTACPDVKVMTIPSKDANQCVIDGKAKALYNATFKVSRPKNTRLVYARDLIESSMEPPKYGELSWPWEHINKATRGIRLGHVTYLGAGTKMGKSTLVDTLGTHFVTVDGVKVFMAKPEEENAHTMKLLAGKIAGKVFHDPEVEYDKNAYLKATEEFADEVTMVNLWEHMGWESLKEDIAEAVAWGAKVVFIDPITNLTSGVDSSTANTLLEKITGEISVMAMDFHIHVFICCHLRAYEGDISQDKRDKYYREDKYVGLGGCPHEFGGNILSSQFAGSRAMQRKCQTMVALEGNRDPNLPEHISNIRQIKILEEREFGAKGIFPLFYNEKTSLFSEI